MTRSVLWLLTAIVLLGASAAGAADVGMDSPVYAPGPTADAKPPKGTVTGPVLPPPNVPYGCKRVWRCDAQICEWRRGCWGVYGYVEGPYYTSAFARRQWEAHGWPGYPRNLKPRTYWESPVEPPH